MLLSQCIGQLHFFCKGQFLCFRKCTSNLIGYFVFHGLRVRSKRCQSREYHDDND